MPDHNSDHEQLQQRNQELTILNTIARALNGSVNLKETLETALAQAAETLGLHTGWIWLIDEDRGEPYLAASQNLPRGLAEYPERMEGSCYCLDTYRAGDLEGAANVNVITCSRLKKLVDGTDGLRYHASIPLYAHEKQLGVLNLASTDWRELSQEDLRLLYTIGDLLGIAIERARLFIQSSEYGAVSERNRLAREIHDTLAQGLAGIALQLETADALLESGQTASQIQKHLQQALELTRENLEEARRSVLDLRAAPLQGKTLSEALSTLVDQVQERTDLQIRLHSIGANHPLPRRVEAGLYRIAQEALNNVGEHAQAKQVGLQLMITSNEARLVVQDDGVGFDLATIETGKFGLVGLGERTKLLGGQMDIDSESGKGTRLEFVVPLTLPHG